MEKTKILVVDDHRENIVAMTELIADEDIDIYSAENAEQALNHILEHEFALALLDVQMPGVSGFELARLIRGVSRTRNLPVIFVTAEQRDQSIIFEGYETGAVDLMFKPLDPYIVRSKVQAFVQLDHQARLLREQMKEVESLRKRAEDANLAKSQFLANMSHEIRTPLASVLGFSDVLSQENLSDDEKEDCLAAIRRNGELLLRLIDDILDLSKIEAQQLQFLKTEFSLDEILNDIGSTLDYRCEQKGISLEISRGFRQGSRYYSDPIRIKQILLNIVGNAVKFTTKGKVQVDVTTETISKNATKLRFHVKDSGIGISETEQANLFQPFSQADISTRRRFGGTGLGLVIARHLARSLSGDLVLNESAPGVGSVFEISLVVAEVPTNKIASVPTVKTDAVVEPNFLQGVRLLIVDDVADNRMLIDRYLKKSGATIIEASSGTEALRLIEEAQPDLVLMDIQMPVMDGYEATTRARENGYAGPIIALTAHAMKEEIRKCLNAGCNEVITKPARRQDLLELLKRMTEGMKKAH
ncbi:MAG TPA: response regulator [Bdellovibrio sp.]|uniref:response regulator n=1 Tax=Bdellovibrio sp. TaxID=28201 RepID=UPI002EE0A548